MSKNSDWDIPSQKFNFKKDLEYGHKGEGLVKKFLSSLESGAFEVKSDRYRNGRMAVEIEQNPFRKTDEEGNQVWNKSGIKVTKAHWWVYVYTLDDASGAFIVVSVKRLKKYLRVNSRTLKLRDFAAFSKNPARGFLLEPSDVMDMMINPKYDD
jgi:hypothetical protein